jgi:hypothetical protein
MPTSWLLLVLLVTTILCKSAGALALLAAGLGVLFVSKWTRSAFPMLCLMVVAPLYMGFRMSGHWSGEALASLSADVISEARADSLRYRLRQEDMLSEKALQRPVFGWGGWGRNRVRDDAGRDISVTDGLWIIALGNYGFVGLSSLTASLLTPALLAWWRLPVRSWATPALASTTALTVALTLYMIDSIPNGMVNPIFLLTAGAVGSVLSNVQVRQLPVRRIGCSGAPVAWACR